MSWSIAWNFAVTLAVLFLSSLGPARAQESPDTIALTDVSPSKYLYFAIAAPGRGLGSFGHAFLVFTSKPKVFLSGYAYQYNNLADQVMSKEGLLSAAKKFKNGTLPMTLNRHDGAMLIQYYANKNQLVSLYPLKITAAQVQEIQKRLETDLQLRKKQDQMDWGVKKNCLTQMIEHINAVVGIDHGFSTNWQAGDVKVYNIFSRDAWAAVVPPYFERTLRRSGLVDQAGVYRSLPVEVTQLKQNLELLPIMTAVFTKCKWAPEQTQVIRSFLFNNQTRFTVAFQKYFVNKLTTCVGIASQEKLDILELLSHDLDYYSNLPEEKTKQIRSILDEAIKTASLPALD